MTHRQAGFVSLASFAGLNISSFVASRRTLSGGRAEPARAQRRAWWHAAAAGVCALLLLLVTAVSANAQSVSLLSAEGTLNASAGGQGLYHPCGVAVDRAGDVFIADAGNNRVVEVPAGGGAPITLPASGLNNPQGVAVDGSGDVFIADAGNNRVVELPWNGTSYGTQTTLPFSGLNQPEGVAVDSKGNVFIGDSVNTRVVELPWTGTSYGAQTTLPFSGLYDPQGVAVDGSGDVFVVDRMGQVWELPWTGTSYGTQTDVSDPTGLDGPWGVAVDGSGNVFIADTEDDQVVEVPAGGGTHTTLYTLDVDAPVGLAVDGAGNVFISDHNWNKVVEEQRVSVNFQSANVCPAGQTTPAPCSNTLTLTYLVTGGSVTFASTPAVLTQGAPNLDFTQASGDTCAGPEGECDISVTFAPLAPGLRMGAVQLSDSSGNLLVTTMLYGMGQGPAIAFGPGVQSTLNVTVYGGLDHPQGVAVDAAGDVFIADAGHKQVVKIPPGGGAQTEQDIVGDTATGVAVDGAGNFFASGADDGLVFGYPSERGGVGSLEWPTQLALDGAGDLFVADSGDNRVVEVPWTGTSYGQQTTVASGLNGPYGVAVDGAGNVFIGDTGNNRVVEVPAGGGAPITVISSGLNGPHGVAVDAAGDLFIADSGNNRVVELPAGGGALITVGGGLSGPYGVAVDAAGDVFIADTGNNRVVEVQMSQAPSLSFATTLVDATSSDSPQSVTAQNIGNQLLDAVSPGLSIGSNSFVQVAGPGTPADCTSGFSLAPGASCNLSIDFTPQIAGSPLTGSATFTDNALNTAPFASQSVGLSGIAQGQAAVISSASGASFIEVQANSFTVTTKGFTSAPAISEVGALPYGVLFVDNGDGTATLEGIPAIGSLATYNITITASNAIPQSATQSFTLTITSAPLSLLTITASSATMTYGGTVPTITPIYSLPSPTLTGVTCSTQATISTPVGTYISNCTGAVGNYAITYATGTVTVGPATLTASIINNPTKPYDGTNTATLGSSNFQLSGLVPGQSITETATVTGTYASVNAGTGIPVSANLVSVDFTAGGSTQLTNYTLPTTASGTGQITPLTLTAAIVGNPTRPYDGTTTATLTPSNFQLTGLLTGESITVTQTVGAYNSQNVATATTVTASLGSGNFTPVGSTLLTNYVLPTTASGPGQIAKANQTITVATAAPTTAVYNTSFTVAATASSNDSVAITTSGGCSGSGSASASITMTSGTTACTALFDQAGDSNYNAAPEVTESVTAQPASQTINVTTPAPASAMYNTGFTVAATGGGSGNAVTFSSGGVCSSVGATFTMTSGTGTCTVKFDQAGNSNYSAATEVTESVTAQKAAATVTLSNLTQTYTGSPLTPTATTIPANLTIVWTDAPDSNPGSYSVTATVNDPNYQGSASGTFNINKAAATSTVLVASPNPSTAGQLVVFTATVTGSSPGSTGTPTGTVQFLYGGSPLFSPVALVNGGASIPYGPIVAGAVQAVYSGDANFAGNNSPILPQAVTAAPVATVSPSVEVQFTNEALKTTSAPVPVTLSNFGTAALTLSSIKVSGANSGDFAQNNNCPRSLAPSTSCTIYVTFSPQDSGERTATLNITDNDPFSSPQMIGLSGLSLSVIKSDFNRKPIAGNTFIWFSSSFKVRGPEGKDASVNPVQIFMNNSTINFTAGGTPYTLPVPNAVIVFDPNATDAKTTFDTANNRWVTTLPSVNPYTKKKVFDVDGNTFLAGLTFPVPSGGLPGDIDNVTWSAALTTDTPGVSVQWRWGAAVYTQFTSDYNSLGVSVKPVDDNQQCRHYQNGDDAGTPENYKQYWVRGATGDDGDDFTGDNSKTVGVLPTVAPLGLAPTELNFGNQSVGYSGGPQTVALTNPGVEPMTVFNIAVKGTNASDFTRTNNCPMSPAVLSPAPANTCTVSITFTPGDLGARSATLSIISGPNSGNQTTQTVDLGGNGTP